MIIGRAGPERLAGYRVIVLVAAITGGAVFGSMAARPVRPVLELKSEDALARMAPKPARPDIAIVALDDRSVQRYGAVKTWRRSVLADGLRRVEEQNPKWVVLDISLDQRTHTGDEALWREIANNRNVLLGMGYDADRGQVYTPDDIRGLRFLEREALTNYLTVPGNIDAFAWANFIPPMSDFTGSARGVGVFDRETDDDGVVRTARMVYVTHVHYPPADAPLPNRFPPTQFPDGWTVALPNIALVSALRSFDLDKGAATIGSDRQLLFTGVKNRPVVVPLDGQERMNIRFGGAAGRYQTVSFVDLIDGKTDADKPLSGKIVLVGATAPGDEATDARLTPVGMMPRIEITANALQTMVDRSYFLRPSRSAVAGMMTFGLMCGLILMFFSGGRQAVVALVMGLFYLLAAYLLFAYGSMMVPVLPGLMVIAVGWLIGLLLYLGPYRPVVLELAPGYMPPTGRTAEQS